MKISDIFRSFKDVRNLSLRDKIRVCYAYCRRSFPAKEKIDMETLYQIIGHINESYFSSNSSNSENHPIDINNPEGMPITDKYAFDWDSYINRIKRKILEHGFENHIVFKENPDKVLISEKNTYYQTKYKITVKNMIINVSNPPKRKMLFCAFTSISSTAREGIYLIFENNDFVGANHQSVAEFYPQEKAYLVFKNNKFKSANLYFTINNISKIELKDNVFENSNLKIAHETGTIIGGPNIIFLDNNIFYRKDGYSSQLKTKAYLSCYFKGKNTVDNLILNEIPEFWGGYQNIDPQGEHAHAHQPMFIRFMEKAVEKNDKMQEARLRRELTKCDRALLRKENIWSLQDNLILLWSSLISDYGILWFRPIVWLFTINALLAIIVNCFFNPEPSGWFLFAEFFNPLSNLSTTAKIDGNGWISFINTIQKGFFFASAYEAIKVFRRFSKL